MNRTNDGGKVVFQQDQRSRFARNVRATLAHDNADVCSLECRRVVDARLLGDSRSGARMVASDHHHANAGALALRHGGGQEINTGEAGLAIVADLVQLYGGSLQLGTSPLGGLKLELRLPAVS
jgi:hypothetical protein